VTIDEQIAKKLGTEVKPYSTRIEAAWEIVEQPGIGSSCTKRTIYPRPSWEWMLFKDGQMFMTEADTAPMAICLAFLKLDTPANKS